MPTIAGTPDSVAFLSGGSADVWTGSSDAVWSSREAAGERFVFAGSRWRSAIVRGLGLLVVGAALAWMVTLGLGLQTAPTTVPAPTVEGHRPHR
jgi:hypothetical protein